MEINVILDSELARKNFLKGLILLAKADSIIDEDEVAYFSETAKAMGLNSEEINAYWNNDDEQALEFSNMIQKKFFLRAAIELCCIDDSYAESEQAIVHQFATDLGVPVATLFALEEWVQRGVEWRKEGNRLVQEA